MSCLPIREKCQFRAESTDQNFSSLSLSNPSEACLVKMAETQGADLSGDAGSGVDVCVSLHLIFPEYGAEMEPPGQQDCC